MNIKRITTDDANHILAGLNLFFAKDNEVWIRGGGPDPEYHDCTLVDWIRRAAAAQGIELEADDAETMGEIMYDSLQFGVDCTEGILALLHEAAVQAAEMRGHLKILEDILGDEYDTDHLHEIMDADREGRLRIARKSAGRTCGTCGHFQRIPGTCRGRCEVRSVPRNMYGVEEPERGAFTPSQSRIGCRQYEQKGERDG